MKTGNRAWVAVFALLLLFACGRKVDVRPNGAGTDRTAPVFPDYREVTVPGNIAPLNFYYTDPQGSRFVTTFTAAGESVTIRGRDVVWKEKEWTRMLAAGGDIKAISQYKTPSGPMSFAWFIHVSPDPIDGYLTYRLIEPGFEVWDDLEIVERNLSTFDAQPISDWRNTKNKCMNCHIHAQGRGDLSMFYLRGEGGGAILNRDGKLRKLTLRDSTMISATVYGEIHPKGRYGVFSTNIIIPGMHSFGNWVYDCAAPVKNLPAEVEQTMYSLVRRPFDAETGTLGAPADTVWSASERGLSVCHPKASPDGRWLLFTVADYGTFPINHRECDLRMLDLRTGEVHTLDAVNADKSDTYHSWSSDAKWFVFASKRGDGMFGKPWFSHVSEDGSVTKPFLLPQKDPHFYDTMTRSFNVPDLGNASVGFDAAEIGRVWREVPAEVFD